MSESRAADGISHVVVLSPQRLLASLLECHPARLMRDPCSYNQSLSRAGATTPSANDEAPAVTPTKSSNVNPIGGTLLRRWRAHFRCDDTCSSGMVGVTSEGELPPGSRRHDREQRFEMVELQECPGPPMTPALREQARKAVQVVTAEGRQLSAGRAVLFVLEEIDWHPRSWCALAGRRHRSSGPWSSGIGSWRATGRSLAVCCSAPSNLIDRTRPRRRTSSAASRRTRPRSSPCRATPLPMNSL